MSERKLYVLALREVKSETESTIDSKINVALKGVNSPISKLHSILAVVNLLAHNNLSQICYCRQIIFFFVSLSSHFYMGSLFCRQSFLLCTIPTPSCFSCTTAAIQSFHMVFGFPLPLRPYSSMSIILLSTTSSSLLST